jgi:hypothetical protein
MDLQSSCLSPSVAGKTLANLVFMDGKRRVCEKIMRRAYDNGDMLYVPTPNKVFAVNKEVVFQPYKMACMPLWKIQVTDKHWSVRQGPYPEALQQPVRILRMNVK